jgi:hypothetical protein
MQKRSWRVYVACAVAVVMVVGLVGCPPAQDTGGDDVVSAPPPSDDMPADGDGGEETAAAEFEWTAEPTVDMIGSGTITGELNGEPFEAKSVRLEKADDGTFELTVSNKAVEGDDPTAMVTEDDAWELTFTAEEGKTGEWTWAVEEDKDFEKDHVYYWYQQEGDEGPMSVNYSWGAALQIDEWTLEEPAEDADTFSDILGNVRGKVALVMDDDEKSWVAGEFDAVYYEW